MSVVLVTGCSSGIGMAAAVEFARQGAIVVATMRDLGRSGPLRDALAVAGCEGDVRALDVDSDAAVPRVIGEVIRDHGCVDIVVSNAGIGIDGTTEELSLAEFRRSFETNVLGGVRALHALLPPWRARGSGRFIAVSSVSGALGMPFNDAYCMSKFALEGLLESLHPVVAQHGISVSIVEPGPVAGDFAHKYAPSGRVAGGPYDAPRAKFQAVQDMGYDNAQTNEEVAAFLWQVATAERPALRYQTSDTVARMVGLKLKDVSGERVTGMTSGWI